jgi:hypothetical protein
LVIRQSPLVHFQVVRMLEQLRVARGLPVRSRFPERLFAVVPEPQHLNSNVSIHYWMERPLLDLLSEWTKQTGVPVLVDWSALALEGWTPSTATAWTTGETTAREALDGLCEANEWVYRWLPIGTVHIMSRAAAASRETVQLYPLAPWTSEGHSSQQAGERLYQAARQVASAPDDVVLVIDAPSQTALVRTDVLAHQALRQGQPAP